MRPGPKKAAGFFISRIALTLARPHPEGRAKRGVSKDEGGRGGRPMVRDARLRRAPHHEAVRIQNPSKFSVFRLF